MTYEVWKLHAQIRDTKESALIANGWEKGQWKWFNVWRKTAESGERLMCLSVDEALAFEGALQNDMLNDGM